MPTAAERSILSNDMKLYALFLGGVMGCAAAIPGLSQDATTLDSDTAQKHLIHKVEAVYPAIAKAAQVQGAVGLQVSIAADGKVTDVKVLSGPPLLRQAAMDAVQQWVYEPFSVNGQAVKAVSNVMVYFSLPDAESAENRSIAESFFPLSDKCHKLMASGGDVNELVSVCGEMAAEAEKFAPGTRFIERRSAFVFDAAALLRARQYPEAEAAAKNAVAVAEEGHDDASGVSAAYAVLGNAQALHGNLEEAVKSLETAETLERKALDSPAGQQLQANYTAALKTTLLFHADTLDRMGKKTAAAAKRAEAEKLTTQTPGSSN
jgi:TonB family protein